MLLALRAGGGSAPQKSDVPAPGREAQRVPTPQLLLRCVCWSPLCHRPLAHHPLGWGPAQPPKALSG